MPHQRTTSLSTTQFATLITTLNNHLTWLKPDQRPRKLTLPQALKITLISYRHHLTQETLAYLLEVSQPTISQTTAPVKKAPTKVLEPLNRPLGESLKEPGSLMVNGTLTPPWNWRSHEKLNFSGKHQRAGFNHQVICTLDGRLLAITNPLPGARDDVYAFRAYGLERLLDSSTVADKGCVGLGLATPIKCKSGQRLNREQRRNHRVLNCLRSVVERGSA